MNKRPVPLCGMVYFVRSPGTSSIRIGHATSWKRVQGHIDNGMVFIAAIVGDGNGKGTTEDRVQEYFSYCLVTVGGSRSHFAEKEVQPYVQALIDLHYASTDWEWAKCCSQLPWRILDPERVLNLVDSFYMRVPYKVIARERDDWQTPVEVVEAARSALGGVIDLDPASEAEANIKRVKARWWYSKDVRSLDLPWEGNIFLNPPYNKVALYAFVSKLLSEYEKGNVKAAVTVTNLQSFVYRTGRMLQECAELHAILPGRVKFIPPPDRRNKDTGNPISFGSSKHGTICSYLGDFPDLFQRAFENLGAFVFRGEPRLCERGANQQIRRLINGRHSQV